MFEMFARIFIAGLLFTVISSVEVHASTWYVSRSNTNGYGVGSDANTCKSPVSPCFTINQAVNKLAASGDTIIVNPGAAGYPDIFAEHTAGYTTGLVFPSNKNMIVEGDPGLISVGLPVLTSTTSGDTRAASINSGSQTVTLANFTVDSTGISAGFGVSITGNASAVFSNVTFQNTANGAFRSTNNSSSANLTFTGCTFASSVMNDDIYVSTAVLGSLTVTGSTFNNQTSAINGNAASLTNLTFGGLSAGQGNIVNGQNLKTSIAISLKPNSGGASPATVATLLIENNVFEGASAAQAITALNPVGGVWNILSNTGSASGGTIYISGERIATLNILNNTISNPSTGTGDPITVVVPPAKLAVAGNIVSVNSTTQVHGINIGGDGFFTDVANVGASTGTQYLDDTAADAWVAQSFKTSAAAANNQSHASYLGGIQVTMAKIGQPAGAITVELHADNGGQPAPTTLATSSTILNASSVGTSPAAYFFAFATTTPVSSIMMTPGATYWYVIKDSGAPAAGGYIALSKNTAVAGGALATASGAPIWVGDPAHALLYTINTAAYGATVSDYGNITYINPGASATTHGNIVSDVNGPLIYQNATFGGSGLGLVIKDTYQATVWGNVESITGGTQQACRIKGAIATIFVNNTCITSPNSTAASALALTQDFGAGVNALGASGMFENNIILASNGAYAYNLDSWSVLTSPTIDYNDAYCFSGCSGLGLAPSGMGWAAWQKAGYDVHGINADPVLPVESGDTSALQVVPGSSSPVIGMGANVQPAAPTDYFGNPFGAIPSLGAVSYQTIANGAPPGKSGHSVGGGGFGSHPNDKHSAASSSPALPGCAHPACSAPNPGSAPARVVETAIVGFKSPELGSHPASGLVEGADGALFGETYRGGAANRGEVFMLTPDAAGAGWRESVIYSFKGGSDGGLPMGTLVRGGDAALYGVTTDDATVFRLAPPAPGSKSWSKAIIYRFGGAAPVGRLTMDRSGDLYAVTRDGGKQGVGAVFKLTAPAPGHKSWTTTLIYSFDAKDAGAVHPSGGVIVDRTGAVYGATSDGGTYGMGTVFKLSPPNADRKDWRGSVLSSFTGANGEGANPVAGLTFGPDGAIYGATYRGGRSDGCAQGCGTIFALSPPTATRTQWLETPIYAFTGIDGDGSGPAAGVIADRNGALFGTTEAGGDRTNCAAGCGTLFKLEPPAAGQSVWIETVLHAFGADGDGAQPEAELTSDSMGALYGGTASGAPAQRGMAFKLSGGGFVP